MKTGTVAILASCLLGQALAAPLKDKLSEIPVKVDGETKDIKIDDLKDALKDLVTNAPEALNVGTPAKRGDDKVKEVLGALGLKKDDLDKKVLKKVQDKVEGLTDTAASPISRFSDIGGLLEILKPLLEQAGGITGGATGGATDAATGAASGVAGAAPKKRTTDPLNTILGNLGIDAKDLDKKTLKKVEKKVEEIADQSATPISRAAGLGSLLDILKPLLAGAEEQVGSATDSAKGLTDTATNLAGSATKGLPVGGTPAKRDADQNALKQLLQALGLDGALDSVTSTAGSALGGAGSPAMKRGLLDGLLGGGDKDSPLKGVTDTVGGAVDSVGKTADGLTGGLTAPVTGAAGQAVDSGTQAASGATGGLGKRQVEGLLDLLLGGDKGNNPLKGVTKPVGGAVDSVGKTTGGLTRRQLDGLLDGLLGGGKGDNPLKGLTDTVGGTVDSVGKTADGLTGGLTAPVTGAAGQAVDSGTQAASGATGGLGKRQVEGLLDLLLGGDKGNNPLKGVTKPVGGAVDSVGKTTGGLTRRQLDGLLDGLLGGGKGDNPLKGLTDTVGGTVDSVGKTADGLTGGLTSPVTGAAGQAVDSVGKATGGLTRRQLEGLTGLLDGLLGTGPKDTAKGAAGAVGDAGKGASGGLADTLNSVTGGLAGNKRQLEPVTDLLGELLGGGKGDNPLKGLTDTVGGAVDSVGKSADGLTGGLTAPVTGAAGQAVDAAGGAASGATGLGKRQGLDIAALLQALGPVLGQLKDNADSSSGKAPKTPAASTPTPPPAAPAPPAPAPPAAPKVKRQELPIDPAAADPAAAAEPAPAPADITPAALPEPEDEEPLSVIFDDLSEVSSLLGEVEGAVPAEQVDTLRETIDAFLSSISNFLPEGAAPDSSPVAPAPEEAAPTPIP